jgi:hypothetical protein
MTIGRLLVEAQGALQAGEPSGNLPDSLLPQKQNEEIQIGAFLTSYQTSESDARLVEVCFLLDLASTSRTFQQKQNASSLIPLCFHSISFSLISFLKKLFLEGKQTHLSS